MTPPEPVISVVVPTRNRPERLHSCLTALAAQRVDGASFEVIVVDDGGEFPLNPVVSGFTRQMDVRLVVARHGGPARARNIGAAGARGTMLVFTDDDCEAEPNWLAHLYRLFVSEGDVALGGQTVNALPENARSTVSQLQVDYLYAYHGRMVASGLVPSAGSFFTSNNLALSAVLFRAIGGFDEGFPLAAGEDRDLCARWLRHGYRLRPAPLAVLRHSHDLSLRGFWRQHMNYGRGAFHLHRARLAQGHPPPRREPLTFYLGLVAYPLRIASRRRLRLTGLMALSQVANTLGFMAEASKRR